ncbi:DNA replication licensing factor Mcm2 [Theileria orientalis strain Shintoku]|uniref:DNA replication licensing factor Mcm2 n=1 Tax=Theileria orientalis strain Shintoku TaxID=869250 RepID=J4CC92_THEOR|nr:DNA replication licensing factor Mcm2 [Theileria orientalis strain Shintoku]BAM38987.1 DNA replication licensing factor Mcm2 [Theileria orientalis strain Shintoku]|eukprot:XP_009689288.1 DNA replication licensing factor Mcm2 [Theileria orientalis strain Shintoku]
MSQYSGTGSSGQLTNTQNSYTNQHLLTSEDDTSKLLDFYDRVSSGISIHHQSSANDDSVDRKKKLLEKLNQDVLAEYEESRQGMVTAQQNYRSLVERFLTFASENKQIYSKTLQLYEDATKEYEKSTTMTQLQMPMHLRLIVNVSLLYLRADQSNSLTKLLIKSPYLSFQAFEDAIGEIWKAQNTKLVLLPPKLGICGWLGRNHVTPRGLSSTMINALVAVEGVINKCSGVYPKLSTSVYVGEELLDVFNEVEKSVYVRNHYDLTDLNKTRMDTTMPPPVDPQGKVVYRQEVGLSNFKNYQTFVLQETPEDASLGQMPRYVSVIVQDDLCNRVKCGDRVRIWGVYRMLTTSNVNASTMTSSIGKPFLVANHMIIKDNPHFTNTVVSGGSGYEAGNTHSAASNIITDEDRARFKYLAKRDDTVKILTNSVAPSICGLSMIKKGILLQLIGGHLNYNSEGGSESDSSSEKNLRGDIHVLLVGDPGCGKSQLLRFVMSLFPNTISTTGRGSTGVGLTAAIIQDEETGERRVEGGAMFDKMNYGDRVAIHEVMEQQTVSVAKAGIHTTLNARCTVLAAANPLYGCWSEDMQLGEQLNFEYSLLSRFDLIFVVRDANDEVLDDRVADAILRNITQKARPVKASTKLSKTSVIQPKPGDLALQVQYTIQAFNSNNLTTSVEESVPENLANLLPKSTGEGGGSTLNSLENTQTNENTDLSQNTGRRSGQSSGNNTEATNTQNSARATERRAGLKTKTSAKGGKSGAKPGQSDTEGLFGNMSYLDEFGAEHEVLDLVTLKKYISYCKSEGPELSLPARNEISRSYAEMRQRCSDNKKKLLQLVSPRTLEAILRLSTAFAKLKLSRYITRQHVRAAVKLLNYTIFGDLYSKDKYKKAEPTRDARDDDFTSSEEEDYSDVDDEDDGRGGKRSSRKRLKRSTSSATTSSASTRSKSASQSQDRGEDEKESDEFTSVLMKQLQRLDFGDGVELSELYLAHKSKQPVTLREFKKKLQRLSRTENAPIVYSSQDEKVYTC